MLLVLYCIEQARMTRAQAAKMKDIITESKSKRAVTPDTDDYTGTGKYHGMHTSCFKTLSLPESNLESINAALT